MSILNYRLAHYTKGKRDYVSFWAHNPKIEKLERIRLYQSHTISATSRARQAKIICEQINLKLVSGWSPFVELQSSIALQSTLDAIQKIYTIKIKGAEIRTISTYKSRVNIFTQWLKRNGYADKPIHSFDKRKALEYMDFLLTEKNIVARTYNGYLTDMRTFFNAMVERSYIKVNPFSSISKRKEQPKSRVSFTDADLLKLKEYLTENNGHFLAVCYYCYYAALRPVEICRLKVKNLDFEKRLINIFPDQSKNDRQHAIPMLPELYDLLIKLELHKSPPNYYIVSNRFVPGPVKFREDKIAKYFKIIKRKLDFKNACTFYSLKDTIAERLLKNGFEIKFIQQLFRHHDISITNAYLSSFNPIVNKELLANFPKM